MSTEKSASSEHWNQRYLSRDAPWDSGLVSCELTRVLKKQAVAPCKAFEFGCGNGTNAVYLARQGFEVFAADLAPFAIDNAARLAKTENVGAHFFAADLCRLDHLRAALGALAPECERKISFLFDRGCYHCARRVDLSGFLEAVEWLAAPNAKFLLLCGNANEHSEHGPSRLTESEVRSDWDSLFTIDWIHEFRFEDRGGKAGPLGWSSWMTRRT